MINLLEVRELQKFFPIRAGFFGGVKRHVRAVDRVSFQIRPGETLGLVGESGCGKTTVGRSILRLIEPTGGSILFKNNDITRIPTRKLRELRTELQLVFQDPYSSLNPRMVVLDLVGEGLTEHRLVKCTAEKRDKVVELLEMVGLSSQILYRYPHEFSGGQRQRLAIARALALKPSLLVCDEPVSALDVSVQSQIINLLVELRDRFNMAYLFIGHDLAVVKHISHRIAVMYLGQIVELAPANDLFQEALHPYTKALLAAIPVPDPKVKKGKLILSGEVDNTLENMVGCSFVNRCPAAMPVCHQEEPPSISRDQQHLVKCFLYA